MTKMPVYTVVAYYVGIDRSIPEDPVSYRKEEIIYRGRRAMKAREIYEETEAEGDIVWVDLFIETPQNGRSRLDFKWQDLLKGGTADV